MIAFTALLAAAGTSFGAAKMIQNLQSTAELAAQIPVDPTPGGITNWDWTRGENFGDNQFRYVTPWDPAANNGTLTFGDVCPKHDGWELYDRRLFQGDRGLQSGINPSEAGARYFLLYNRFSGVLRLFYYDALRKSDALSYFGVLSTVNRQNAVTTEAQGGLFDIAGSDGSYTTDLSPRVLRTPSSFVSGMGQWLIFDWELAYQSDRLTPRYFQFAIYSKNVSTVKLEGTLNGTLTSEYPSTEFSGLSGYLKDGIDLGVKNFPYAGLAKIAMRGTMSIERFLRRNGDLQRADLIASNQDKISTFYKDVAAPKAIGYLSENILGMLGNQVMTQSVSAIQCTLKLDGTISSSATISPPFKVGVAEPSSAKDNLLSGTLFAPPQLYQQSKPNGLGVVGFRRAPRIWVYAPYAQEEIESQMGLLWVVGTSPVRGSPVGNPIWGPRITYYPKHEFVIEDALCAGAIRINPYSEYGVKDYGYAVQEKAWTSVFATTTNLGVRNVANPIQSNIFLQSLQLRTTPYRTDGNVSIDWPTRTLAPLSRDFRVRAYPGTAPSGSIKSYGIVMKEKDASFNAPHDYLSSASLPIYMPIVYLGLQSRTGMKKTIEASFRDAEVVYLRTRAEFDAAKASNTSRACVDGPRATNMEFDPEFYQLAYGNTLASAKGDFQLYLENWISTGIDQGRIPSIGFDPNYYLNTNGDLMTAFGRNYRSALWHFQGWGIDEGRASSSVYNGGYYFQRYYSKLTSRGITTYRDAYKYFLTRGIYEGDQGSINFSAKAYLDRYPDLRNAYGSDNYYLAAFHWIMFGQQEGRVGTP